MVQWLSSSNFPFSSFICRPAMVTPDQISTFFFNICRHKSSILTQYHLIPSNTKLYWPSTTKYHPVPLHSNQYHNVSTSSAPYWPNPIIYQPVRTGTGIPPWRPILTKYLPAMPHTDQVPPSTNQYCWPSTVICHIQMSDFPLSTWDEHSCTLV